MEDIDVIRLLEKNLGVRLERLDKIQWDSCGYEMNQEGKINAIGLFNLNIKRVDGIIPKLAKLSDLRDLRFIRNKINDISAFQQLENIECLDFLDNEIVDIVPLKGLVKLRKLSLIKNRITNIEDLNYLINLEELYVSQNQIEEIQSLSGLRKLSSIDLGKNLIIDISFISNLVNLKKIHLHENQIKDISHLKNLEKTESLYLWTNQIVDITDLENLVNLLELNLDHNKIETILAVGKMSKLKYLYLYNNKICDISSLMYLDNLERISLAYNQINDISSLGELRKLKYVDFSNNNISSIPEDFVVNSGLEIKLDFQWNGIVGVFKDNPIINPPVAIIRQGKSEMIDFFESTKKHGIDKAYEAKLIIIGEPGAGKTTLMKLLFDENYPVPMSDKDQPSTLGVQVMSNRIFSQPDKNLPQIKANVWDFGGQDIQYMLHQYFLTDNSVYILLTDGRTGKNRYGYWFHIIRLLGHHSPVIVLLNKHKESSTIIPFDAIKYREIFHDLKIIDAGDIDLGNLDHKWNFLIEEISKRLAKLPIMGQDIIRPWKLIREELEKLRSNKHITLTHFKNICNQNGLMDDKEQQMLLDYFHTIGVALNFKESALQNTIFLDPNWITHAIYDALNDEIIKPNGCFMKDDLYAHWQNNNYNEIHLQVYTQTECNYLFNLMLKNQFEICYPLESDPDRYIVPMKLPDKRSDYDFITTGSLRFRYQYPFMPEGLMSRLIVRLYQYIVNGNVWLSGVFLHDNDCDAEVIQYETSLEGLKYISIRVNGDDLNKRRELLRVIRSEVKHIHKITFPYVEFSEMVVCNCPICERDLNPNFYSYNDLQAYQKAKEREVFCTKGMQRVDIRKMVDEVYIPEPPIIKIFLASSSELSNTRKEFKNLISEINEGYIEKGIILKLEWWEDHNAAMSINGKQADYNKTIQECDIFVSLFHTKIGEFTEQEFETAWESFRQKGKPQIYTYFNDTSLPSISETNEIIVTLNKFKTKLNELKHFYGYYNTEDELKNKLKKQLEDFIKKWAL